MNGEDFTGWEVVKTEPSYIGKAQFKNMNQQFMGNFEQMAQEYYAQTGQQLKVSDAWRSHETQAEAYRNKPNLAAKPGHSLHEKGMAMDLDTNQANQLAQMGLLDKYGFERPMMTKAPGHKYEPWHIQLVNFEQKAPKVAAEVGQKIIDVDESGWNKIKDINVDQTTWNKLGNIPNVQAPQTPQAAPSAPTKPQPLGPMGEPIRPEQMKQKQPEVPMPSVVPPVGEGLEMAGNIGAGIVGAGMNLATGNLPSMPKPGAGQPPPAPGEERSIEGLLKKVLMGGGDRSLTEGIQRYFGHPQGSANLIADLESAMKSPEAKAFGAIDPMLGMVAPEAAGAYEASQAAKAAAKARKAGGVNALEKFVDLKELDPIKMQEMIKKAKSFGIDLTVPEVAGSKTMQSLFYDLAHSPGPQSDRLDRFFEQVRVPQVKAAIDRELGQIAGREITPYAAAAEAKATAGTAESKLLQTRTAGTKKLYEGAAGERVNVQPVVDRITQLTEGYAPSDPRYTALQKVKGMLVKEGDVLEDQVGKLHNVKTYIDKALRGGDKDIAVDADMTRLLTNVKAKLTGQMEAGSELYRDAQRTFRELSKPLNDFRFGDPNRLPKDKRVFTVVKRLSQLAEPEYGPKVFDIVFGPKVSPETIGKTRQWFEQTSPGTWDALTRSYMEQVLRGVEDKFSAQAGNIGGMLKRKLFEGATKDQLRAALSTDQFQRFSDFMDVLDTTRKIIYTNSMTWAQMKAGQYIEEGGIEGVLKNIPESAPGAIKKLVTGVAKLFDETKRESGKKLLVDAMLNPQNALELTKLRQMPEGPQKVKRLAEFFDTGIYRTPTIEGPRSYRPGDPEIYSQQQKPPEPRQEGGPVEAGQPYIVGEKGPEVIVPKKPGMVVPNPQQGTPIQDFINLVTSAENYGKVAQALPYLIKGQEVPQNLTPTTQYGAVSNVQRWAQDPNELAKDWSQALAGTPKPPSQWTPEQMMQASMGGQPMPPVMGITKPVVNAGKTAYEFMAMDRMPQLHAYKTEEGKGLFNKEVMNIAKEAADNPMARNPEMGKISYDYTNGVYGSIGDVEPIYMNARNRDATGRSISDYTEQRQIDLRREQMQLYKNRKGEPREYTEPYAQDISKARSNVKTEGGIAPFDCSRGCLGFCPECYAAFGKSNPMIHAFPKGVKLTGDYWKDPSFIRRIGENGEPAFNVDLWRDLEPKYRALMEGNGPVTMKDIRALSEPAMDWSWMNKQISDTNLDSAGRWQGKRYIPGGMDNTYVITKLPTIKNFDPTKVRNLQVSVDTQIPGDFFTTLKNVEQLKQMYPDLNVMLRIRSISTHSDELNSLQKIAVDFANKYNLPVLETRLRFKKPSGMQDAMAQGEYIWSGAQYTHQSYYPSESAFIGGSKYPEGMKEGKQVVKSVIAHTQEGPRDTGVYMTSTIGPKAGATRSKEWVKAKEKQLWQVWNNNELIGEFPREKAEQIAEHLGTASDKVPTKLETREIALNESPLSQFGLNPKLHYSCNTFNTHGAACKSCAGCGNWVKEEIRRVLEHNPK